jgi:hypothetical protein
MARHQAVVVALLSVASSTAASIAFTARAPHIGASIVAAVALLLLVMASLVPARYSSVRLIEAILPVIFNVLDLKDGDRLAVHYLHGGKEKYEQLTDYFPTQLRSTRGRVFSFSHGIVGQCFKTNQPHNYSVPEGVPFEEAMAQRWSFSREELSRLSQDRRSFMAFPIGQDGFLAQAVLYFDSSSGKTFDATGFEKASGDIDRFFLTQLQEALRKGVA